jgi:hypothetical protein
MACVQCCNDLGVSKFGGHVMTFAQYCRIETAAGGVTCSNRDFIRAARAMLSRDGKSRAMRHARRMWLYDGLDRLETARRDFRAMHRGRA